MRNLVYAISVTLLVNAVLAGWLVSRRAGDRMAERPAVRGSAAGRAGESQRDGSLGFTRAQEHQAAGGALEALVDYLRALDIPLTARVGIVREQLAAEFAPRFKEAVGIGDEVAPYWSAAGDIASVLRQRPEARERFARLSAEMNARLVELLGDDYFAAQIEPEAAHHSWMEFMSRDQAIQILKIGHDGNRALNEVASSGPGGVDRSAMEELQAATRASMQAVLTSEQIDAIVLKGLNTPLPRMLTGNSIAAEVRRTMAAFEPSAEEFAKMVTLERELAGGSASESSRLLKVQDLHDRVAASLPPERAAEYRLSLLPGAVQTARIVQRLGLPRSAALETLAVQKDIQDRWTRSNSDPGLSAEGRNEQMATLVREANSRLVAVLGWVGFEAYRQNAGAWLRNIGPVREPEVRRP